MKQDLIAQLEKIIGNTQADEKEIIHHLKRLLPDTGTDKKK